MPPLPSDRVVVFESPKRGACHEPRLVLAAAGIAVKQRRCEGQWALVVDRADLDHAARELAEYDRENRVVPEAGSPIDPTYEYAGLGVVFYSLVIVTMTSLAWQYAFDVDWLLAGRMEAGRVVAGQWWRVATALTLHQDGAHLAGNLAFGGLFGYLVGRTFGGGVAWLAILIAGASGNAVNAIVQDATHRSIGASTATYAALGIVVACHFRPWVVSDDSWLKRCIPLIGGAVLLTFTGFSGERTDVMAHLAGFLTGMLAGWAGRLLPPRLLANKIVQQGVGWFSIGCIATVWMLAILWAG